MHRSLVILLLTGLMLTENRPLTAQIDSTEAKPPVAKRVAKTSTFHQEELTDDYFWLREKSNPEVISYLEAENAYADALMKPTAALQEKLYQEMLGRIKETDVNVPYKKGDYLYYTRTVKGQQYPIYARKRGRAESPEEITLDPNEAGKGHKFTSVGQYEVSDDGQLLAYTLDLTGYRQYALSIKDLKTGRLLPDRAERVTSVAWANDNRTLFYVTEDPVTKRSDKLFRHTIGASRDELVYEEKDEMFGLEVEKTRSRGFVLVTAASHTTSEVRYLPADRPAEALKVIRPREPFHEYYVDHHGDLFYIRTNEGGAKNFKLAAASVRDPRRENWKEVLPHRKETALEKTDFFARYMVLYERENGLQKMRITDLGRNETHYLQFSEPVYSASPGANAEFETDRLRFNYQSFVTPASVYDYHLKTRERELLKQTPVLGDYDPARYASERIHATAADGTRIPISLVYKKDLRRDGARPMLLNGYGSYGYPLPVTFSSSRLSLLDRGVIFAVAHIRGGGEMGKEWHDAGKMMAKKNTFTDFIAAAEHLVKEKYTSQDRLAIEGGSAGGLLMGAVVNLRPDLFRAVISRVPFVDVINTMMDATLPLTVGEYQEWGNPNEPAAYAYMKSYSPYDNLAAKDYPAMLVKTSLNDSQVMYWEPAKYVAKLRTLKTDRNPLLLKTNMGGGHGGASGRYDALRELAFDYAFLFTQLGIKE